jgi:hypothetical protein
MAISLFIGLLICALTLFLVIEDTYREIVSISIIFLSTIKVFIADDIYSCILYGILAIMYGVGLYSLETEDRTN